MKQKIYGTIALLAFIAMGFLETDAKSNSGSILPAAVCLVVFIFAAYKARLFYGQKQNTKEGRR